MKRAYRYILLAAAVILIATGAVAAVYLSFEYKGNLQRLTHEGIAFDSIIPKVISDLEIVQQAAMFSAPAYSANAGPFFSQHLSWFGTGTQPLESPSHKKLYEVFSDYPSWREHPLQVLKDKRLTQIETGWLSQLHRFDHWNFYGQAELNGLLEQLQRQNGVDRLVSLMHQPSPSITELLMWAIAHSARSHSQGKTAEAMRTLRKLADLLNSSASLAGNMTAAKLLTYREEFAGHYKYRLPDPIGAKAIEAYRRLSSVWPGIVLSTFRRELPMDLRPFLKTNLGFCGGLGEAARSPKIHLSDFLEPSLPLEPNFAADAIRLRDFMREGIAICHAPELQVLLAPVPPSANPLFVARSMVEDEVLPGKKTYLNPARIPFVRRNAALSMISLSEPNWARQYE